MRIHPDLLGAKPKWQLPAVLGLLASTIFVSGLLAEGNNRAIATQSNRITNLEVVVLRTNVTAGQLVQSSDLALEVRPIDTVPEGAFTKIEDVAGKRVGVDLRTGSLIAKLSLAALAPIEPVAVPPAPKVVELPPPPKAIVPRPRIMPAREMPPKVEPVKIEPEKIEPAKIETVAPEPAKPVPEVATRPVEEQQPVRKAARRKFRSYAWVAGGQVTYGVSKSGRIQVIDRNGAASPLDDYEEDEE